MRGRAADVAAFYEDVERAVGNGAGGAGKQAPRASTQGVGQHKATVPYQPTGRPDAARLGAATGLTGAGLCVAAATWLLTTVAGTDMPMVTRLIIIVCLFTGGAALAWLGGRIERLGGGGR